MFGCVWLGVLFLKIGNDTFLFGEKLQAALLHTGRSVKIQFNGSKSKAWRHVLLLLMGKVLDHHATPGMYKPL